MATDPYDFQSLYRRLNADLANLVGNLTETLTAAGSVLSAALSINSATANAQAFSATATQLTTARTSGTVAAYKGSTTSLAGDSGGAYAAFWAAAPTDGGGSATHTALLVGAGHDILIDASGAATGEADILIGANLASAFQVRSAADTAFYTVATTTATPSAAYASTSTAANSLLKSAMSVNAASATGSAIKGSGIQLTTARSGGVLAGVEGTTTSLAGDTGGTYAAFYASAPTDGGGTTTHCGFYLGSGHDAWADLSGVATGEADVILRDNLASAFELREGANVILKVVTTNSSERLEVTGLQTVARDTAGAITGATALTLGDSGGVFSVAQSSAYDIDLPSPTSGPGLRYLFYLTSPGAFNVTITVAGGAATFEGTIVNDVTSVLPATGATLTFATGAAALGDTIEIISISTSLYLVRAVSSAAGGITIA